MRLIIAILLFGSAVVSAQTNRPLAAVNTIADLVARSTVNNERVIVAGWRTPGDWGPERIIRHDPASVEATNIGCVFASSTAGRYIADDCASGQVNVRWWGGTNDLTALAAALTHVLSRPASVEIVDRAVWIADGTAPTAEAGTMALYATNLAGVHELGIAHGGGSNNIVATKAWVGSTITGTAVTSVGATSDVAGLSFSGSPVTTTGTLGLTGVVGEASIDIAIARLASPALSGNPTAPTATPGDNDTSISTTAFVAAAIDALKALQLWQNTNAVLTALGNLTGGNSSNFWRGDGVYAQVGTNDVTGLPELLAAISPTGAAYDLLYGTNVWRQYIVGTTNLGGFELPVLEWIKTTNTVGAYYFDLAYLGDVWRTQITNIVVVGGFEMPVLEVKKL